MLVGITENGNLKNVKVSEKGELLVREEGTSGGSESTLCCNILTIGTEATNIDINKMVTSIMVANYSDSADITITNGEAVYQVGSNLAIELPINAEVGALIITSTIADAKVQLVIKGVG